MRRSFAAALYMATLRSFPPTARARYGAEMVDVFEHERAAVRRERGHFAAVRYVLAACADAMMAGREMRQRERDRRGSDAGMFAGLPQDVRHAVRGLSRSRTFTLVCLASLSIGLGINAVIMVFLRGTFAPPAAVNAEGAVELVVTTRGLALDDIWSYPDFVDVQRARTGMDVTGWAVGTRHMRADNGGDATAVTTMYVSANYFSTLGISIPRGRAFLASEDGDTGEPPVVLSHAFWQDRLGGDAAMPGALLNLNGTQYRVVGVAPRDYRGHRAGQRVDVWLPLWTHPLLQSGSGYRTDRGADGIEVLGRLHNGVTMAEANGAVAAVMRSLGEANPGTNRDRGAAVVQYTRQGGGASGAIAYAMIMGLAVMVLLVVCLNVAGMVLVRSATKQRELMLRMALGASRGRLMRYLMTESGIIAMSGALLSVVACLGMMQYIAWKFGRPVPLTLVMTAIAVCVGLSLVAMIAIGLAPALRFSSPRLLGSIRDDAGAGGRSSSRIHKVATSMQTALALPLLVINLMVLQAAGLMDGGSYGFEQDNLYVGSIDLAAEGYSPGDAVSLMRRIPSALAGVAGIERAAVADAVPLDYVRRSRRIARAGAEQYTWASATRATEDYLPTLGTRVLRGRGIQSGDTEGAEPVALITQSLARELFADEDPLGKRVLFGFDRSNEMERTVVGVIEDVAGAAHDSNPNVVIVPLWQQPVMRITIAARSAREDDAVASAIEDVLVRLDPRLTRPVMVTSRELMAGPRREIYEGSIAIGIISLLTLLLAAIGVYGVVAFAVTTRTREIGVRMAMGASRSRVLRMVLADGARLAVPGLAIGAVLATLLAHAILARWYVYLNRAPLDWAILGGATLFALAVVLAASAFPARRAAGVEPMMALREQ